MVQSMLMSAEEVNSKHKQIGTGSRLNMNPV
jgi:hypothetical protein